MTRICINFSTVYNDMLVAKGLINSDFFQLSADSVTTDMYMRQYFYFLQWYVSK